MCLRIVSNFHPGRARAVFTRFPLRHLHRTSAGRLKCADAPEAARAPRLGDADRHLPRHRRTELLAASLARSRAVENFQILDSEDQVTLIKKMMKAQELDENR